MYREILFIWFGNYIPIYTERILDYFKKINNNWNINFIHKSKEDILKRNDPIIENIYRLILDEKSIKDNIISMSKIVDYYKYIYLQKCKHPCIYCDIDCFPVAPFDNFVKNFNVTNKNNLYGIYTQNFEVKPDCWLLSNIELNICPENDYMSKNLKDGYKHIRYMSILMNEWEKGIFIERKKLFDSCRLELYNNFINEKKFPLEHYFSVFRKDKKIKDTNFIEVK